MSAGTPTWRETAPMAFHRGYHNLTLLRTAPCSQAAGCSTSDGTDLSKAILPAEIWNPDTETWTTVASLHNGREYHSTALLLPDGRVLMAGGGSFPAARRPDERGDLLAARTCSRARDRRSRPRRHDASYGSSFDVTTPNAAQIAKVSLIRSPSVTHAFDQNQRFQFLTFTAGAGKLTVQAPANANLAPPGDYMLFLVDTNGVPSVGSFVRVSAAADGVATDRAHQPDGDAAAGQADALLDGGDRRVGVAATTCTGRRRPASRRRPQTGSRSRPAPPSPTRASRTAPTTTRSRPRMTPATSARARTRRPRQSPEQRAAAGLVGSVGLRHGKRDDGRRPVGNGNAGTLSSTTWSTTGKYGGALSFNGGNAYVSVPDSNSLDLTTGMTLEGWVKPTSGGAGRR